MISILYYAEIMSHNSREFFNSFKVPNKHQPR